MIRYLTRTRKLTEASLIHHTKPKKTEKVKTTVDMLRRYGNHLQHWLLFSSLSMVSSLWRMADSEYIFEIREQIDIQTRWSQYFAFSRRRSNQYRPDGTASICPADSHFNHFWDLAMRMSTANDRQLIHDHSPLVPFYCGFVVQQEIHVIQSKFATSTNPQSWCCM